MMINAAKLTPIYNTKIIVNVYTLFENKYKTPLVVITKKIQRP